MSVGGIRWWRRRLEAEIGTGLGWQVEWAGDEVSQTRLGRNRMCGHCRYCDTLQVSARRCNKENSEDAPVDIRHLACAEGVYVKTVKLKPLNEERSVDELI